MEMNIDEIQEMQVSNKVSAIPEALSIHVNQLVQMEKKKGRDIITLSLGEAFFKIPMFDFNQINFESGYHYSDSCGLSELREKIKSYYNKYYDADIPGIDEILISCGSKAIIYMAIQAVINEGDEVLVHEPAWLSYQEQVRLAGGELNFIPYDTEVSKFYQHFTEKTRMLIINNPNNPSGRLYTKEELSILYAECLKMGIYLLVDEAYSNFVTDGQFTSIASIARNLHGVIVVNSLSKNMGISGWRIGYAIADRKTIYNILKLNQHIITCAPTILQLYIAKYFDDIEQKIQPQILELLSKRRAIQEYMDQINIKYLNGNSTFYFFVDVSNFEDSIITLCEHLLLKFGIAVVPGEAYGATTNCFVRISIGTESIERIKWALDILKNILNKRCISKDSDLA